jgi:aminobenzoyl-glutamate utilization protein B
VQPEKALMTEFLDGYQERMIEIAKGIWGFAELGMEEVLSSALLAEELERQGFSVKKGVAGMPTAFEASWGDGKPVIGILAEYDALPGLSNHPVPRKDPVLEGAPGHGCGHNLFGTASMAGAVALKSMMEKFKLSGTVKCFGTPAEEVCIGKPYMARDGCFKGIDAFLDWHPDFQTTAYYRTCNAYASVRYTFRGVSAHGNKPWLGRSALEGAEVMGVAVNFLRGHMNPGQPPEGASTINYTYTQCGQYPNVIPDVAEAWYIYRLPTRPELEALHQRIVKCAQGAAMATDTQVEAKIITGTHDLLPNEKMAHLIFGNLELIGPPQFDKEEEKFAKDLQAAYGIQPAGLSSKLVPPSGGWKGVTDSSEPSWFAPYGVVRVACRPVGIPGHSWGANASHGMSIGFKGMSTAAKALALSGADLLTSPNILEEAKKEFREKVKGKTYTSLIPPGQAPPLRGH